MTQTKYGFIVWMMIGFIFVSCRKDKTEINTIEDFETYLSIEMDNQHIPAAAVLIFKGDQILYENYEGYSNLQQNTALADNHLFLIASISKVVTATAATYL